MNPYRSYPPGETDPKRALRKLKDARDQLSMFGAVLNDRENSVVPRVIARGLVKLIEQRRTFLTCKIIDLNNEYKDFIDKEKCEAARLELGLPDTEQVRNRLWNYIRTDFETMYGSDFDDISDNVQKHLQN